MTRLIISTTIRHVQLSEASGYIYIVDLENQAVLQRCEIIEPPYRDLDSNPRGGLRGSRGIAIRDDQIAITNASSVFRYDPQWNLMGMISHPLCSAYHDIFLEGNYLWVTSTSNDLIVKFTLEGNLVDFIYLRDPSLALEQLGWKSRRLISARHVRGGEIDFRNPRSHMVELYDHAHVNSICILSEGEALVSLGLVITNRYAMLLWLKSQLIQMGLWSPLLTVNILIREALKVRKDMHSNLVVPIKGQSAILRFSTQGVRSLCLAIPSMTVPSHSLLPLGDNSMIYLNTTQGCVVRFDPKSGEILFSRPVTDGFLRGAAQLSEKSLLLGSKGEIILFDLSKMRVENTFRISDDPREAVYDIKILPSHYSMPPESFESHFLHITGIKASELVRSGSAITAKDIL